MRPWPVTHELDRIFKPLITLLIILCCSGALGAADDSHQKLAATMIKATGIKGGLVVHLGCGDGKLTAALRVNDRYLVHGLDRDAEIIRAARQHLRSLGVHGKVSVDQLTTNRLPYIDNLVNLIVAENPTGVSRAELMRVLCPQGVAYIKQGDTWTKTVKPRPAEIDEWTHYLHDATNNAVSRDTVVAPPDRLQWVGSPRHSRHHDRMSSLSAAVSAGGRIFYIFDEASRISILLPPEWTLIARDAFNGTILWKRALGKWHTHLWPLKSGPAQLPRRLVAAGDRVYVTLSIDGPVTALDAATGETVRTYEGTAATEEAILADGVLFLLVNESVGVEAANPDKARRSSSSKVWDGAARQIVALRAASGERLWKAAHTVLPATLAADGERLYFHDGASVVSLDRSTGKELWRSEEVARSKTIQSFYLPILVVYKGVVLFSGGETAGQQTGSWYTSGKDTMTALSAATGKVLWSAYHPPSGYRSPEDLLVANGLVWTGETTSGRVVGTFTGRDPYTGEVKSEFPPDVDIYWFHHRCYRGKATDNYLLMARTGTEFIDVKNKKWVPHHWFRGACLYGIFPANGLIYAPQNPCACYQETKLNGFNALAPASSGPRIPASVANQARLQRGPAYGLKTSPDTSAADWPTYRADAARSGRAKTLVPTELSRSWQTELGGRLTSPVIAGGRVYVASVDDHTVHALDASSGKQLWHYTAGGRVDSPPTVYHGRVFFGSADGWVYCLSADSGALAWRFRAAPMDERLLAFEQVESVWPVPGNVLILDDVLYCVSGRSMFVDGGLRLWRLDPGTGKELSSTVLYDRENETGKHLQEFVSWLNMPPGLPDILSSDGRLVYMRSQPFKLDGTRLPLKPFPRGKDADAGAPDPVQDSNYAHIFCPTGFLDDSWWHRTYWLYGSMFVSGWCGYYRAGKTAPAGRILVSDENRIYGYGRHPKYFRWTTPIEHHLFAADRAIPKELEKVSADPGGERIRVASSATLDPAGTALTVSAWVKATKPGGVVLAHGGGVYGYALYLKAGQPYFAIRINNKTTAAVRAKKRITGRWTHLAGVLTVAKELKLYVNGELDASIPVPGLIEKNPAEGMEIGVDEGSIVADYQGPFPFQGLIDEVSIHREALDDEAIAKQALGRGTRAEKPESLALHFSFDNGKATDTSTRKNHGTVEGVVAVKGKIGLAMQFSGKGKSTLPPGFLVKHEWTRDVPLFARALILSGKTLFLAGPPDIIDEPIVFKKINDEAVQPGLNEQAAAFAGKKGALLVASSTEDGKELARYELDSPPVFDGMAAADRRLYIATVDGKVVCLGKDD